VAGVAAGVACGLVALSKHDAAVDDPSVDAAESTQRSARTFAQSANWLFGVGGAVAAAGAVWISIDLLRPRSLAAPAPASATLLLSASGVGWSAVF
jgi:hypothetical protein